MPRDIRKGGRMCLHSAYEAGGVVYVRGLDPKLARGTDSNTCSNDEHTDLNHPTEPERNLS
jgi:hypothetical protein